MLILTKRILANWKIIFIPDSSPLRPSFQPRCASVRFHGSLRWLWDIRQDLADTVTRFDRFIELSWAARHARAWLGIVGMMKNFEPPISLIKSWGATCESTSTASRKTALAPATLSRRGISQSSVHFWRHCLDVATVVVGPARRGILRTERVEEVVLPAAWDFDSDGCPRMVVTEQLDGHGENEIQWTRSLWRRSFLYYPNISVCLRW